MKKNSFKQGAFIATIAIIIVKLIGILYVIPFYAIIGEQGGALYGYGYAIYTAVLAIATIGIPLAMSKLVSEYKSLGKNYLKERAFKLGKYAILGMSALIFLLLMIFAGVFADIIIGDIVGGNTKEDVELVIRIISFAILIVPLQSVTRGYLEGHKFIKTTSISQIIEQVMRVLVIILGSFLALKVFNASLNTAVGVAMFGATAGAIISYFYIIYKIKKNKEAFNEDALCTREESKVTDKEILKKIFIYSIPFVIVGFSRSLYDLINTFVSVRVMVDTLHYSIKDAESILSVFNVWGKKLNMIIIALSTGLVISLIPNISSGYVKGKYEEVKIKIRSSYEMLLYFVIPMTVGLALLATPVWNIFYGESTWGPLVFSISVFVALFTSIYTVTLSIMQSINKYKVVLIGIGAGLIAKILLIIPLMISFEAMGLYAFYGIIISTIIGYLIAIIINLIHLSKTFDMRFEKTFSRVLRTVWATMLMSLVILLLNRYVITFGTTVLDSILEVILYSIIGGSIYFVVTFKTFKEIFGDKYIDKFKKIFKKKN